MEQIQIGTAKIDITPPVGVTLWGYNPRISTFVEHPLRAEAMACAAGNSGWILVCADIGAFSAPLTDQIRADVARQTGLAPEAVMLTATHTHSGPHVTDALWCERSPLESAYFQELRRKLTAVAATAWETRSAGELVYAEIQAPAGLACNRRIQKEDGTWTNKWSDPERRHTGYCDTAIDLLGVRRADGKLEAVMVNFGCHPVSFNSQNLGISADYVGYLKDAIEADGQVETTLFTVSGHANVDPCDGVQSDPGIVRRMGEQLAGAVIPALAKLKPLAGAGTAAGREPWEFTTTWNIEGRLSTYFPYAGPGKPASTAISAVAAGDLVMLGLPGETVSEYRQLFRGRSPFAKTLLISVANDFIGYLPTDEILRQGAYEANMSPLSPLQEELTNHADSLLTRLKTALL